MKNDIAALATSSGVLPSGVEMESRVSANTRRYRNDPEYRNRILNTATIWNGLHKERTYEATRRLRKNHGAYNATACRLYRERRKKKAA